MALQSIGGVVQIPDAPVGHAGNVPATAVLTIDADGEGVGVIFEAPETGTITGMGAPTGTTITADGPLTWELQTVTVSAIPAIPSGTDAGSGSPTAVSLNPSPYVANTWYDAVFTNSLSVAKGDLLAAVIYRPASGTFNGQFKFLAQVERAAIGGPVFPYSVVNASAGWVANQNNVPTIAINYGGTYYQIRGMWPLSTITATTLNTGTTPDVAGARWIPRFKCRVTGVWMDLASTAGSYVVKFYDTDGVTVLATATAATNLRPAALAGAVFFPFSAAVTPVVGSTYFIGLEPDTTTNVSMYDYTAPSAAIMAATPLGADFCYASAKDPAGTGDWTAVATRKPFMGLQIDQLDDGAGGGGLLAHPGMSGRMGA